MIHLEILLEEQSMANTLNPVLEQMAAELAFTWKLHPYQGKKDLLGKLPKLFFAYSRWIPANYRFLVVIDQDQDDCITLKQKILEMAARAGLGDFILVRVVVPMLESWFLGDAVALERAFPRLQRQRIDSKAAYRQPEQRSNPADDLDRELKEAGYNSGYLKLQHSTEIAPYLRLQGENKARSFNVTLQGIENLIAD